MKSEVLDRVTKARESARTGPPVPPPPDPFAVYGPRIESKDFSNLSAGYSGLRLGVNDLKIPRSSNG